MWTSFVRVLGWTMLLYLCCITVIRKHSDQQRKCWQFQGHVVFQKDLTSDLTSIQRPAGGEIERGCHVLSWFHRAELPITYFLSDNPGELDLISVLRHSSLEGKAKEFIFTQGGIGPASQWCGSYSCKISLSVPQRQGSLGGHCYSGHSPFSLCVVWKPHTVILLFRKCPPIGPVVTMDCT